MFNVRYYMDVFCLELAGDGSMFVRGRYFPVCVNLKWLGETVESIESSTL